MKPIVRENAMSIEAIIDKWIDQSGPLLPILLDVKKEYGSISDEAIDEISKGLNLSRAEVYGVVSFYEDFHRDSLVNSKAKRIIKVCTAEACQAQGCRTLVNQLEEKHKQKLNEKGTDITIESVYCLGNCALGPSVMLGDCVFGRATLEKVDKWIA